MSRTDWTLEAELKSLAGASDLADALSTLGLADPGQDQCHLETTTDWYRSGAETYLLRFSVRASHGEPREYVLKACVGFSPAQPISSVLDEWISRRRLIEAAGVAVPRLIGHGKGLIVEEYIPHALSELLAKTSPDRGLLLSLAQFAGVLSAYAFQPIGPFVDLRSRGVDVSPVDFGQDLGPPGVGHRDSTRVLDELGAFLRSNSLVLDAACLATFDETVRRLRPTRADS